MSVRDPDLQQADESSLAESEPFFSADVRAALRRDLDPDSQDRKRVRAALWSTVASGTLTPAAQRADGLLHAKAAGAKVASAAGAKAAVAATVHSVTAKLVVVGVLIAGGTTAAVMRGSTDHERPGVEAASASQQPADKAAPPPIKEQQTAAAPIAEAPSVEATRPPMAAEVASERLQHVAGVGASAHDQPATRPPLPAASAAKRRSRNAAGTRATRRAAAPVDPVAVVQTNRPLQSPQLPTPSAAIMAAEPAATAVVQTTPPPQSPQLPTPSAAITAASPVEAQRGAAELAPQAHKFELGPELALVRAASDALQRGDTRSALAHLERHATQFPHGGLAVEVQALRAIALCTAQADSAAAASRQFLAAHGGAPLAERVRRACIKLEDR